MKDKKESGATLSLESAKETLATLKRNQSFDLGTTKFRCKECGDTEEVKNRELITHFKKFKDGVFPICSTCLYGVYS